MILGEVLAGGAILRKNYGAGDLQSSFPFRKEFLDQN